MQTVIEFAKKYWLAGAIGFCVFAFSVAGALKLVGTRELHDAFALLGVPPWFGYFIGAAEVSGAIGLVIAKTRMPAALGLAIIMVGAVYFHAAHTSLPQTFPALVLLSLTLLIAVYTVKQKART
ncbi:MAG: DoxX family protein [Pseudomonadota bacterium]